MEFTWSRRGQGYEVSTHGDKRFSAMCAKMLDGRTLEMHYQCDVKGYQPGGTDWRLGKGKPPVNGLTKAQLWEAYFALWLNWAEHHPAELAILREQAALWGDGLLTDKFATSPINQARALAEILNR